MAINVSLTDVASAEAFLVQYLQEKIPEADFTPGSAVRDLCVSSIAYVFAFLRKELQSVKARQSLMQLSALPADEDVDEAVDAILSNMFITRKVASPARAIARLTFLTSMPATVFIPATTTFTPTNGPSFTLASGTDLTLVVGGMRTGFIQLPTATSPTEVLTYDVPLVCTEGGLAGNIPAQVFSLVTGLTDVATNIDSDASRAAAAFVSAELIDDAFGGVDKESTAELLSRAPVALATRNMVNSRAISNRLLELVPDVTGVTVIGSGDAEMMRDEVTFLDGSYTMRVGGMVDVYARLPRTVRTTAPLVVGDPYVRPDGQILVLHDDTVDFTATGAGKRVDVGDIVRIHSGFSLNGPEIYTITQVDKHEVTVEKRTPFPEATDEYDVATYVTYSIGALSPAYEDKLLLSENGKTSRRTIPSAGVVLPRGACYRIKSIELDNGTTITEQVNKNPTPTQFSTYVERYAEAQSISGITSLYVGGLTTGNTLTVRYDTVSGLEVVQGVLSDPEEKTVGVDVLAKALHPVYVSVSLKYRTLSFYADSETEEILSWLKSYIENYRGTLRTSTLQSDVRDAFSYAVDSVDPLVFEYQLYAPDGQVFKYRSNSVVTLFPTVGSGAVLLDPGGLRTVNVRGNNVDLATKLQGCASSNERKQADSLNELRQYLAYLGVSDKTVRLIPADTIEVQNIE